MHAFVCAHAYVCVHIHTCVCIREDHRAPARPCAWAMISVCKSAILSLWGGPIPTVTCFVTWVQEGASVRGGVGSGSVPLPISASPSPHLHPCIFSALPPSWGICLVFPAFLFSLSALCAPPLPLSHVREGFGNISKPCRMGQKADQVGWVKRSFLTCCFAPSPTLLSGPLASLCSQPTSPLLPSAGLFPVENGPVGTFSP